jgi:F-type H+-transporting ATPase subunit a
LSHDPNFIHVNAAVLVFLLTAVFSVFGYFAIKGKEENYVVPPPRFSLVHIIDIFVEALYKMTEGTLGAEAHKYFPFIGTLFIFIFFNNFLGLLPFSSAATSNPNTTFALGISAFIYYNYQGIKAHGIKKYAEHFLMGLGLFGIPIAILEIVSHMIRPLSLGLRLSLNMTMDHTIVHTFSNLVAWIVPVPLLLFGVVVCTIQAFVFSTLTAVYIQLATEHEHEEAHH